MACLLESKDVVCFWNGKNFKIKYDKPHKLIRSSLLLNRFSP